MADTSIELQDHRHSTDSEAASPPPTPPLAAVVGNEAPDGHQEFSLPPADGGKHAWLFLAACFLMEGLVWGFPFAFGIFQNYYRTHEPFAGSSGIAVIGTCSLGIMYLDMPFVIAAQRLFPRAARWAPVVGITAMCASLAASSFSQTTSHLIATQGVMYAISGSISYCPCILYMEEWFIRRKGLAYGVMWSGTGLGGFALPLLLEHFLGQYGFRTTLRIWAVSLFLLTMPLVYFIKPRLPISSTAQVKPYKLGFVLQPTFVLYQTASIIESTGYFLPAIYLPSYARSTLGAGPLTSALTVLLVNVASVFGIVILGTLVDRLHVTTCIMISTVGAVLGTFFLWGFAANLPLLYTFCIVYGLFAGSYVASWPGIMRQVITAAHASAPPPNSENATAAATIFDPIMVFGLLTAGRGVGNVVSGPLSEVMIKGLPWKGQMSGAYGSGYGMLVAFTGATAAIGGASFVFRKVGWMI